MRLAKNDIYIEALISDPHYRVDVDGIVWTQVCVTGKVSVSGQWRKLVVSKTQSGHLSIKYQRKHLFIHRIIFRKFVGPLRDDYAVNHIDGNKENNAPANLELITHSENMLHCFRVLGHIPMKTRSKITQDIADEIRRLSHGGASNRELRERYGLAKATISYIVNSRTWKPLTGDCKEQ